ncbi:hypothetical protein NKI41_20570 [Mesorhizobium sp. M0601]|uniref:hypothetical protein n=1 Tax=Mesorhizobium sp. M0601 TaxID=2956969 RepID=UPI00333BBBF4
MAQWGRSDAALLGVVAKSRFGEWSVVLALAALVAGAMAITALMAMPSDASVVIQHSVTGFFMAVFFLVGPLAHLTGAVFGLMALGRPNDNRLLGLAGIVVNGASLAAGVFMLWAMASTIGAFT